MWQNFDKNKNKQKNQKEKGIQWPQIVIKEIIIVGQDNSFENNMKRRKERKIMGGKRFQSSSSAVTSVLLPMAESCSRSSSAPNKLCNKLPERKKKGKKLEFFLRQRCCFTLRVFYLINLLVNYFIKILTTSKTID